MFFISDSFKSYDDAYKKQTILLALVSVGSISVVTILLYLVYRLCFAGRKGSDDQENPSQNRTGTNLIYDVD